MILAVDTSGATGVAVLDEDRIVFRAVDPRTRAHAEAIGPMLAAAAATAAVDSTITAVAFGVGPGPFTGLRVGIAAARMFARARGVAALPIVSHDAIALAHLEAGGTWPFAVVTDARRHEVYWSAYAGLDARGLPAVTSPPAVGPVADLPAVPRVTEAVDPAVLARVAALGGAVADGAPLYLRAPDVTPPKVRA